MVFVLSNIYIYSAQFTIKGVRSKRKRQKSLNFHFIFPFLSFKDIKLLPEELSNMYRPS